MSKGLRDNYQTSTQCSISSSQDEVEEDSSIDIFRHDILILHGEKDQDEANECKTFLMNNFQHISNLQVALPEDLLTSGTNHLPGLSSLFDSCRLVFIYLTKNLESDPLAGYGTEMNILQSIKDRQKKARLIPLQVNDEEISEHLISPIIPLKYVNDTTDRQFPIFKRKFEKLVSSWRNALPREMENKK
ncbi:uncharacterized protein LOC143047708 isoform X2 [Mytilus galloprovincialis]|uniref:uncharacterized protein LOC143047708 isoform X2 n=1 Tax=Mytilus galloprovincialis TaxID=29158 RepID=UPI003F7C4869